MQINEISWDEIFNQLCIGLNFLALTKPIVYTEQLQLKYLNEIYHNFSVNKHGVSVILVNLFVHFILILNGKLVM